MYTLYMQWIFTSDVGQKLQQLCNVFLEKNAQINLSALRTEEQCMIGNIYDSLGAEQYVSQYVAQQKILDIGTGGGFPLLPLALLFPQHQFFGLDSIQKKLHAISDIALKLKLNNVQFICSRCEIAGQKKQYREQFSIVTARAVAPLNVLLEYMSPFVEVGGVALCYKSIHIAAEQESSRNAQNVLGLELEDTITYTLPKDFGERQILLFRKKKSLHKQYPREVGICKKTPL